MVVDTSAVIAILNREGESPFFAREMATASDCLMSAVSVLEAGIVARARKGEDGVRELDLLLAATRPEIIAFDAEQAALAREAFERFGKGRHAAGLNFGDCAVYALAASLGVPLLAKGDDFARTDIGLLRPPPSET